MNETVDRDIPEPADPPVVPFNEYVAILRSTHWTFLAVVVYFVLASMMAMSEFWTQLRNYRNVISPPPNYLTYLHFWFPHAFGSVVAYLALAWLLMRYSRAVARFVRQTGVQSCEAVIRTHTQFWVVAACLVIYRIVCDVFLHFLYAWLELGRSQ